jgi:hypothetical protein
MTMVFSNYGTPVTVTAPPASEVIAFSKFAGGLLNGANAGTGNAGAGNTGTGNTGGAGNTGSGFFGNTGGSGTSGASI